MKKYLLISFMFAFVTSCSDIDEIMDTTTTDNLAVITRSYVDPSENVYFDWDIVRHIQIQGITATLPWYTGSSTTIPTEILNDYKKADGWDMIYNLTSPRINVGYNSIIFYNKFTGKLRYYVHSTTESRGTNTFMAMEAKDHPSLFCFAQENLAWDRQKTDIVFTNNMTTVPVSVSRGWNCFEIELSYDPNINIWERSTMRFMFYDQIIQNVKVDGNISLESSGTFVTTNSNSPNDLLRDGYNAAAKMGASQAEAFINSVLTKKKKSAILVPILGAVGKSILDRGLNRLADSWFSKESVTTKKISELEIKTKGKMSLNGTISTTTGSNLYSPNKILLPGSKLLDEELLPLENYSFGVWALYNTPTISVDDSFTPEFIAIQSAPTDPYVYFYIDYKRLFTVQDSEIFLNPYMSDCVSDHYDLEYQYYWCVKTDSLGYLPKSLDHSGSRGDFELDGKTYFNMGSGKYINSPMTQKLEFICNERDIRRVEMTKYERDNGKHMGVWSYRKPLAKEVSFAMKLTLTLYPIAPYNRDPITFTKTFHNLNVVMNKTEHKSAMLYGY